MTSTLIEKSKNKQDFIFKLKLLNGIRINVFTRTFILEYPGHLFRYGKYEVNMINFDVILHQKLYFSDKESGLIFGFLGYENNKARILS